ncbi:MAG TPA: hypothetical protein GXX34_00135 [Clostridia bacterium]|nr:hypothetical protein [Clostridia bacterium]
MNYLDLLLGLVFLFCSLAGYTRGFISLMVGWAGKIITLIAAFYFAKPLAGFLGQGLGLQSRLAGKLTTFFPPAGILAESDMGRISAQKLPEVLDKMHLPPLLKFKVMERAPELMATGSASVTAVLNELARQSADLLLHGVSFLLLVIGGGLCIKFFVFLVNHLLQGTLIGQLNRLLGMTLTLILALGVTMLVIGITAPLVFVPAHGEEGFLADLAKGSYLYPRFLEAYGLFLGAIISY